MSEKLRFLCFNIHGARDLGGERDLKRLNDVMNHYQIDIGVFQEMETRASRKGTPDDVSILAGPERPYHLAGPSLKDETGWYGNLIVSRYPIIRGLVHNLETTIQYEPRCAVDALIDGPFGRLRLIGTHLSLARWQRFAEVRNLLKLMDKVEETEKNPLFLMGDLNEWRESSKLIKHLNQIMTPLKCRPSFPSIFPILRLDRAWHDTANLAVTAATLSKNGINRLSDHLPIMVEVKY
ncbi:MAG: endonuclease [Micavibrio aeruginosavorus]|uniref:Endonuclease n=1 Tax=Micavibrio aeruginosavorus TaxID=349221 RepID=A0A2W5FCP0_9BACT|nr:MAG: endonuclease [Micavibrio aeruginosavorus]